MTARKKVARAEAKNKEGMTFFENWDLNEAVAAFKEATELSPETAEYYLNLARAYARSGEFDQAMSA
ncbi:MAG: tetratricopeptide repeat protein, partial [Candidatus Thermofonsia bacterium]